MAVRQYAAVILDLGLPDEDGLEVLSSLRQRGDSTPILVLTARGGIGDRSRGGLRRAEQRLLACRQHRFAREIVDAGQRRRTGHRRRRLAPSG